MNELDVKIVTHLMLSELRPNVLSKTVKKKYKWMNRIAAAAPYAHVKKMFVRL